ncbi:hypothetical protein LWI29_014210 [Acer saccharum]|uniref:Uncharacterized protein n=1 Tax=Acer saccharum TaxID=4024 RepID=A0AA39ST19_ACESA|nr:hypothetical protein LWI29_014210 [Acer saccharum]
MFWSSYAIVAHLAGRHTTNRVKIINQRMVLQGFITYAMWAMIGAFLAGTCAVLLHSDKKLAISVCVVPIAVVVFAWIGLPASGFSFMETATIANNIEEKYSFEILDSVYSAAADGDINKLQEHAKRLDQILTPNGNTILHIHITA